MGKTFTHFPTGRFFSDFFTLYKTAFRTKNGFFQCLRKLYEDTCLKFFSIFVLDQFFFFFGDRLIRQKGTKNFVKDCFCFLRVGGAVGNKDNKM